MRCLRRAGLVIATILLAACSAEGGKQAAVAEIDAAPAADTAIATPAAPLPSDPVPENLLGEWVYSHEECDPEADDGPRKRPIQASIWLREDNSYEMSVEGFPQVGTFRYKGGDHPRIQLAGTLLNFNVEGDTLQNWSEGDAPYPCGRVFVRQK